MQLDLQGSSVPHLELRSAIDNAQDKKQGEVKTHGARRSTEHRSPGVPAESRVHDDGWR